MMFIVKRMFTLVWKSSLLLAILISVPGSIVIALEYVSPALGWFPLYVVSIVSLLWMAVLAIPFLLSRAKAESNVERRQDNLLRRVLWEFLASRGNVTAQLAHDLVGRIKEGLKTGDSIVTASPSITKAEPATRPQISRRNVPIAIVLTIDRNASGRTTRKNISQI